MLKKVLIGLFVLTIAVAGSLLMAQPVALAGREKCKFSPKAPSFYCYYSSKRKKRKLRKWASNWCSNRGYRGGGNKGYNFKEATYSLCNRKGKKCKIIRGACTK